MASTFMKSKRSLEILWIPGDYFGLFLTPAIKSSATVHFFLFFKVIILGRMWQGLCALHEWASVHLFSGMIGDRGLQNT